MPLAFPSHSHGTIAFGFFNIETDLLLLERLFFFADRFCQAIIDLSREKGESQCEVLLDGFTIHDRFRIGNLHGAIQGVDLSGFIGATYEKFPFPRDPEGFKQKPYGSKNQKDIQDLILTYGEQIKIRLWWDKVAGQVSVGEFVFDRKAFAMLIAYVDQGGYPKWQDEIRPDYVQKMLNKLRETFSPLMGA
ncbi:MAG: hypothetical protein EHM45_22320 [Desulfobacteraceae bacterium]|nr:MAG: hypothetical protein EHM45_22320 [Desulfobacteraceae bacterium]